MNPYLMFGMIVLGLALMSFGGYCIVRTVEMRRGTFYHRRIGRYLRRWCGVRRYRLLENVTLLANGARVKTDFIIVGIFGIVFLNVFPKDADIYGNEGDSVWMAKRSQTEKVNFANPIEQCDEAIAAVRAAFARAKVYNVQMEQFYVFPCRRFKCFVADKYPVLTPKKFRAVLTRDKYHEEKKVDMNKLAELIRSVSV